MKYLSFISILNIQCIFGSQCNGIYTIGCININSLVVDKSFDNNKAVLDIKLDAENVSFLTYPSIIPFKLSSNLKLIIVDAKN